MKYLSILFVGLLFVTSCSSDTQSHKEEVLVENEVSQPTQLELTESSQKLIAKVIDVSELKLQLNEGEKWVINEESYTQLMKIKQQIYVISGNMENYTIESYNEMGVEFLDFVKMIPPLKDEKANMEVQKVLSATKDQCLFMVGSDIQQAQIAIINLSIIYDEVPVIFESE